MAVTPPPPAQAGSYVCRYCRLPADPNATSCPNCGAPVDVRALVTTSGWVEQPPVRDMAKIQFGHSHCQVEGTLVPVADFSLAEGEGVVFSHHTLLWCGPGARLEAWAKGSMFNRVLAGMPLVLLRAGGPGHLALSEDHPGEVVALPIPPGRAFDVFSAPQSPGLLLLHSPGNLFVRDLAPGQAILVQPSAWVYADTSVSMSLHIEYPASGGYGWGSFQYRTVWLRLTGPGRVAVRSVFEKPERSSYVVASSPMTSWRW